MRKKNKLKWYEMNKRQRVLFVIDWVMRGLLIAVVAVFLISFVLTAFGVMGEKKDEDTIVASADEGIVARSTVVNNYDFKGSFSNLPYLHFADTRASNAGSLGLVYNLFSGLPKTLFTFEVLSNYDNKNVVVRGVLYYTTSNGSNEELWFNSFVSPGGSGHFTIDLGTYYEIRSFELNIYYVDTSLIGTTETYNYDFYFYSGEYVPGFGQGLAAGLAQGYDKGYNAANTNRLISVANDTNTDGVVQALVGSQSSGSAVINYSGDDNQTISVVGYPNNQRVIPAIKWDLGQTVPANSLLSLSFSSSTGGSKLKFYYLDSSNNQIELWDLSEGNEGLFKITQNDISVIYCYTGGFNFTISDLRLNYVGEVESFVSQESFMNGYNSGYSVGFQEGFNQSKSGGFGWLVSSVQQFLDVKFFGDFGIGTLIYVMLGTVFVMLFLKFFAGG